jgi:hypothetical protein
LDRLVQTSAGLVVVGYQPDTPVGFSVALATYDGEGWETSRSHWSEWDGDISLEDPASDDAEAGSLEDRANDDDYDGDVLEAFVCRAAGIPGDEAHRLIHEMRYDWLVEFEERTPTLYRKHQRSRRYFPTFVAWLVVVPLLAMWGLGLTIWLVATGEFS